MKRDEVFEVLEPPPHGLTRLRARMEERRARRFAWPVLVTASAVAVLAVVFWPRAEGPRVDFTAQLEAMKVETATGLGQTALEPLVSQNAGVVLYRVSVMPSGL